ncbi:AAA family ATPase [Mesorhizobium sp. AR07]|uniref:KGGVGR-motif variant AAA ATPase n=1 Tax=Mesorhizobium sp. AR07 TaxID=2865838 RepID=UPI0021608A14|nr:AAA family ATPase [Mesorhizobium sp. AR07]UVK45089.1 AAA family ATPase [Mesorhizobium sp. AR07]
MTIRFDESLAAIVEFVAREFGADVAANAAFIRDAIGTLSVAVDLELAEDELERLEVTLSETLGGYARNENAIRDKYGSGARSLFEEAKKRSKISVGDHSIFFLDRRLVGADWLLPPQSASGIPRIVFSSLKGGVGRSTALAVLAAHMSGRGQRVLAVDLDLEAPGIGTMLISPDVLPKFGTLDYLVENGMSGIDDEFIALMTGKSFLGNSGGQVTVLPAIGRATIENPRGALSKISRAYLEDISATGEISTLTGQIRELVDRFSASGDYDLILIDGRAGLHETNAAVLLGLGAEVLFFGIDEPQTFLGYKLLFSHLAQFKGLAYEDWRQRVQFVHAKCSTDTKTQREASARFADLFEILTLRSPAAAIVPVSTSEPLTSEDFDMEWADDEEVDLADILPEQTPIIQILDDRRYQGFDPIVDRSLLTPQLFELTFGELLAWAESLLPSLQANENGD